MRVHYTNRITARIKLFLAEYMVLVETVMVNETVFGWSKYLKPVNQTQRKG